MFAFARTAIVALSLMVTSLLSAPAISSSYLQCVPFARMESGIQLFGNARDWWRQADGVYERGDTPRTGAVMAFAPTGAMPIGHVAVVSQIVSERELLLSHSNWSPINGRRGQIERNVRAVDVSAAGDWSSVRVWYAPMGGLGIRSNPVTGFIYPNGNIGQANSGRDMAMVPDRDGILAAIVASVGN